MRISDWSSDVCSSDLIGVEAAVHIVVVDVRDRLARCVVFVGVEGVVVFAAADIPALEEGGEGLGGIAGAHRPGPMRDRKSTRLNPVTNAQLVCRLLLEKKKYKIDQYTTVSSTQHEQKQYQIIQHICTF